jgi:23S rRNA pseudouridine2605 synthase
MRLNRYLAAAGLGSRRGVEALILEGQVKVNGQVVEDLGTVVGPEDVVKVGSKIVKPQEIVHAVMYKPRGFLCTASDERERRTIFDLLPTDWPRVYHVGRLDMESEGLLIVTNDGELSLALTHPRFKIEKEYEVTLDKAFDPAQKAKLLRGFHIEGGRAKMEVVEQVASNKLRVVLTQGIKRQIRLMMYDCGFEVENLRRIRIGTVGIDKLRAGMWRMLSPKDVADLKAGRSPKRRAEAEVYNEVIYPGGAVVASGRYAPETPRPEGAARSRASRPVERRRNSDPTRRSKPTRRR